MIVVPYPYEYGTVDNPVYIDWINSLVAQTQQFMFDDLTDTELSIYLQKWYKEILKIWIHFKPRLREDEFRIWLLEYFPLMFEKHDHFVDGGSFTTIFEDILSEDEFIELISKCSTIRFSINTVNSELVKSMMRLMK